MNFVYPLKDKESVMKMVRYWSDEYRRETRPSYKRIALRNSFMIELGVFCLGMRISDLRLVKVSDILDKAEFSFYEQKNENKKDGAKNKKQKEKIHRQISETYQNKIKKYVKVQGLKKNDYLFFSRQSNPDGSNRPIGRVQAFNLIEKAGFETNLEIKVSTHTLRKSFAHLMYEKSNHDIVFVSKLLGHKSIGTTMEYLGYDRKHQREMMEDFSAEDTW